MATDSGLAVWVSALKIILGIGVMVGAIGGALWYADQLPASSPALEQAKQELSTKPAGTAPYAAPAGGTNNSDKSWGIAHDSPVRRK